MGRTGQYGQRSPDAPPTINYDAIVVKGDPDEMVKSARAVGEYIKKDVSSSQIRGVFATVRQIQLTWDTDKARAYRQAVLLKPRIAYAASRNETEWLGNVLISALDRVGGTDDEKRQRFMSFVDFFEAIVAYHKALGGKK